MLSGPEPQQALGMKTEGVAHSPVGNRGELTIPTEQIELVERNRRCGHREKGIARIGCEFSEGFPKEGKSEHHGRGVAGSLPGERGPRGLLALGGVPPSVILEARLLEASSDRLRDPRSHWRTHTIELRTRGTKGGSPVQGASLSSGKNQFLGLVCWERESEDSWGAEGSTGGRMEGLPQGVATTVAPVISWPQSCPAGSGTGNWFSWQR